MKRVLLSSVALAALYAPALAGQVDPDLYKTIGFRRGGAVPPAQGGGGPPPTCNARSPYPAVITSMSFECTWDLAVTAGIQLAPNKDMTNNQASLPAGASVDNANKIVTFTQQATLSRWNFTGWTVDVNCTCQVNFDNSLFRPSTSGTQGYVFGLVGGSPTVIVDHSEFNGKNGGSWRLGGGSASESGIHHYAGNLEVRYTWLHDEGGDYATIAAGNGATSYWHHIYMRAPMQNPANSGQHTENFHVFEGNFTLEDSLIDINDLSNSGAAWTGILGINPDQSFRVVNGVFRRDIIIGANNSVAPLLYTIQVFEQNGGTNILAFDKNVIEKVNSGGGHIADTGSSASQVTGQGNKSWNGGAGGIAITDVGLLP